MSRSTSVGAVAAILVLVGSCRGAGNGEVSTLPTDVAFDVTAPPILDPITTTRITAVSVRAESGPWTDTAQEHQGQDGEQFTYRCPAGGPAYPVWGTETYTDDSSVCTAAVHAGLITLEEGGEVTIVIEGAQDSFDGSQANGIISDHWEEWPGSFRFVGGA